jgi:hypothetical protein
LRREVEEEEMNRTCSTHARDENYIIFIGETEGKDLKVDGK